MISEEILSCIIFCVIYVTIYTIRSYLDQTYLVQITCEIQKLRFGAEHV